MPKPVIQRILVPTDLSPPDDDSFRYAAMLKSRFDAQITFFPVDLRDRATRSEIDGETTLLFDLPARAIVHAAVTTNADLIVMGNHGRSGWRRAILGSLTERVLHMTSVPVITIAAAAEHHETAIRTIVCPVNFTHGALAAVQWAAALADWFDAKLIVVYVVEDTPPSSAHAPSPVLFVEENFSTWLPVGLRESTHYKEIVVHGDAVDRTIGLASALHGDLVVIGATRHRHGAATAIGTTTARIARSAPVPVLIVPAQAESRIRDHEWKMALAGVG